MNRATALMALAADDPKASKGQTSDNNSDDADREFLISYSRMPVRILWALLNSTEFVLNQ